MDFYSVTGNVSCSSSEHVHIDHGYTGYKAEIASYYGCSWDGQTSYTGYLLYSYSTHGGGYFAQSYSNGVYSGTGPINVYEVYYK